MGTGRGECRKPSGFGAARMNTSLKEEVGRSGVVGKRREKERLFWQAFLEDI